MLGCPGPTHARQLLTRAVASESYSGDQTAHRRWFRPRTSHRWFFFSEPSATPPAPALELRGDAAAPRPHTMVAMSPNHQRLGDWFWNGHMTHQNSGSPARAPAGTVSPSWRQKSAPLGAELPLAGGRLSENEASPEKPELETQGREPGLHDPVLPTTRPPKRPVT